MRCNQSGQTIVEIIMTIAVVALMITGLVVGSTSMIKAARIAKAKSVSVQLAREGVELSRKVRDAGWSTFVAFGSTGGTIWCLDGAGVWTQPVGNCNSNIDGVFGRTVTFTWNDPKMTVVVGITWQESGQTFRTDVTSILTQWR